MSNRAATLCFSGHRYYAGTEADEGRLAAALEAAFADGYRVFVSGMARGFDLAAAEAVLRLRERVRRNGPGMTGMVGEAEASEGGVRLVAAIPFARQAAKYPAEDRLRYDALLAAADEARVLSERYSYGCYYQRDDWMVERSARIICWYDGSNSGTRYTVRRAVSAGLEVVDI